MDDDQRSQAIKRLEAKKGLQKYLVTYVVINVGLIIVWAVSGGGYFWPGWVLFGTTLALAGTVWGVYGNKPISEEAIQREMRRGGS